MQEGKRSSLDSTVVSDRAPHVPSAESANNEEGIAQAQQFCDIIIVDFNNREIPIKVSDTPFLQIY